MTNIMEELASIPGGEFLMGSDLEGDHNSVHKVFINTFYMDKHEVTDTKYLTFCKATGHRLPEFWNMEGACMQKRKLRRCLRLCSGAKIKRLKSQIFFHQKVVAPDFLNFSS